MKAKTNPRLRLPDDALIVTRYVRRRLTVVLVGDDGKTPESVLGTIEGQLGGVGENHWTVEYGAAKSGYGPALYDAASLIGASLGFPDLRPSYQQSADASRLWGRNAPDGEWPLPTLEEFFDRYSVELATLLKRGLALDDYSQQDILNEGQYLYDRLTRHLEWDDPDDDPDDDTDDEDDNA